MWKDKGGGESRIQLPPLYLLRGEGIFLEFQKRILKIESVKIMRYFIDIDQ